MFNGHFFYSLTWLALPILSLTLTACDGSGNGEPDADLSGTTTDDTLAVHASASGEATPGLTVTLSAAVEDGGADIRYLWSRYCQVVETKSDKLETTHRFLINRRRSPAAIQKTPSSETRDNEPHGSNAGPA